MNDRADQSNRAKFERPAQELRRLRQQANRRHLLNTGAKLFCAECQRAERVVDAFATLDAKLACGHRREIEHGLAQRIAKLERECAQ